MLLREAIEELLAEYAERMENADDEDVKAILQQRRQKIRGLERDLERREEIERRRALRLFHSQCGERFDHG
jgi:hypothetical protein